MDRYIGLDAYASNCTLGVVTPKGKRVGSHEGGNLLCRGIVEKHESAQFWHMPDNS